MAGEQKAPSCNTATDEVGYKATWAKDECLEKNRLIHRLQDQDDQAIGQRMLNLGGRKNDGSEGGRTRLMAG